MNENVSSPRINSVSWGRIEVEGHGEFKDVKLYPRGARGWDWRETGTEHSPGIKAADVEELLEHDAGIVILTQGFDGRLQVCPETLQLLKDKGVSVHVHRTEEAVRLYNELREKESVGGLFHSTC